VAMRETKIARREFLKEAAGAAAAITGAPALLSSRSPNGRLGVACIGVGTRGHTLLQHVQAVPNNEIRIICDLYQGNIKRAQGLCKNPEARIVKEWEKAVTDRDIDAVIIAAPDFWHAPMVIAAAKAHKDIYTEKGWCTRLEEAKAMRQAVKENKVVMQLGHHYNGLPSYNRAREIYRSGELGKVTLVRTYTDRTNPFRFWKFYTDYNISEMPKDAGPDTIDWERFVANATKRPFSAERFFTWRCWWEYGTGIAGDLMSHLWDGVNMIVGMGIPEAVLAQGGIYFWKGDRDVPDLWNVTFDYPSKDLAVTFSCTETNRHVGEITQLLGREKTLEVNDGGICRTFEGEWKPGLGERLAEARKKINQAGLLRPAGAVLPPDYVFKPGEVSVPSIMENFFACVRSRELPYCHVDRAFEEAATIAMSVESYRQERKVRWDPAKEAIV
jgi:predicted dehydrogenase